MGNTFRDVTGVANTVLKVFELLVTRSVRLISENSRLLLP